MTQGDIGDEHSIKMGVDYQDDNAFYSKHYGTTLAHVDTNLSLERSEKDLEVYVTSFDGALYAKYQIRTLKRFLACDFDIVFCDTNSHVNPEASRETRQLCMDEGVKYVCMPHSKFQDLQSFSFKLGTDLNWIWRNCVRVRQPKYFAILDQDCFLVKDSWDYLKSYLDSKGMYGLAWPQDVVQVESEYWLIHIMNNFFRYDFVKDVDLDFRPAGFVGLDTGGCNYFTLFRHHNRLDYVQSETYLRDYIGEGWAGVFREFTLHDDERWLHIRNSTQSFTNDPNERAHKEVYMTGILDGILFSSK